jgi:DNA topoisomerase-1
MSKHLVIVESPTKARTLSQYLGPDYIVESSIGHVRDLPANASEIPAKYKDKDWARLGVDVDDDFEPLYVVQPAKRSKITELRKALKEVDSLLLATDEDREGEAISWHLLEVLKPKVPARRMVFHEITRDAIHAALGQTREIDNDLVEAQEARRIIDRLYGYMVSPVLWRKIGPKLSAGRVQSVAIRMLVDRERARMRFKPAEYWDLDAMFTTGAGDSFEARLSRLDGRRLASGRDFDPDTGELKGDDIALLGREEAADLRQALLAGRFRIDSVEEKPFTRSPSPPFTTSTLQQEANRKLRFSGSRTMRAAQRLYETGFITYMRTDSVTLSKEALGMTRRGVESSYGREFLPEKPRFYKSKVKNAQEAHEAIRPAGSELASVDTVRRSLGEDEARLYDLIWKRTMASQMKNAEGRGMKVRIVSVDSGREAEFSATGSVIDFPGFLRAYVEGKKDPEAALADLDRLLPPVETGEEVVGQLTPNDHWTTPPSRLTEAGLIKALEESGVGRPSTYASIIETIQRREYTFKKGSALVPTFTAFAVVQLMEDHLDHLIDTDFTARMENRLDKISRGERDALPYLREFYFGDDEPGLKSLIDDKADEINPRDVCSIPIGADADGREIIIRVGRYGPFLQRGETTANIPEGTCPDEIDIAAATELLAHSEKAEEPLGTDPDTGKPVYLKVGRYGPYVQLGDPDPEDKKKKPKMASLLAKMSPSEVSLDVALQLLEFPKVLGQDAAGVDVVASNGRYGPYIKRGDDTRSLTDDDDLLEVTLDRALELLAQEKTRGFRRQPKELKIFEKVEAAGGEDIKILSGRYGPYVTDGDVNASVPKGTDPEAVDLALALQLLEARRDKLAAGGGRRKKKAKKKAPRKKKAKKKTAARKKTAKKAGSGK